jgi:hypothetical protein
MEEKHGLIRRSKLLPSKHAKLRHSFPTGNRTHLCSLPLSKSGPHQHPPISPLDDERIHYDVIDDDVIDDHGIDDILNDVLNDGMDDVLNDVLNNGLNDGIDDVLNDVLNNGLNDGIDDVLNDVRA